MNKKYLSFITLLTMLWAAPVCANVIWPAIYISEFIHETWFLIFGSIIIEALFFRVCIKNISFAKSLLMSCVGNIASTLVGGMMFSPILTLAVDFFLLIPTGISQGSFDATDWIAELIVMCLVSALIELVTLRIIFKYKVKELFIPVLAGNIATYALTWLYFYWYFPDKIPTAFRFWEHETAPTVAKKARRVSR